MANRERHVAPTKTEQSLSFGHIVRSRHEATSKADVKTKELHIRIEATVAEGHIDYVSSRSRQNSRLVSVRILQQIR